jgi:hypothetical protein
MAVTTAIPQGAGGTHYRKAMGAGSSADPVAYSTPADPAEHAAAVTPSDDTDLDTPARALYVGGAGDVEVITTGGETVVFVGVAAGSILPVRTARVKAANTDATSIVALW